jgi:hypothetical protein
MASRSPRLLRSPRWYDAMGRTSAAAPWPRDAIPTPQSLGRRLRRDARSDKAIAHIAHTCAFTTPPDRAPRHFDSPRSPPPPTAWRARRSSNLNYVMSSGDRVRDDARSPKLGRQRCLGSRTHHRPSVRDARDGSTVGNLIPV